MSSLQMTVWPVVIDVSWSGYISRVFFYFINCCILLHFLLFHCTMEARHQTRNHEVMGSTLNQDNINNNNNNNWKQKQCLFLGSAIPAGRVSHCPLPQQKTSLAIHVVQKITIICSEKNRKIRGLKFDTPYWSHLVAQRKIWTWMHNYKS